MIMADMNDDVAHAVTLPRLAAHRITVERRPALPGADTISACRDCTEDAHARLEGSPHQRAWYLGIGTGHYGLGN